MIDKEAKEFEKEQLQLKEKIKMENLLERQRLFDENLLIYNQTKITSEKDKKPTEIQDKNTEIKIPDEKLNIS